MTEHHRIVLLELEDARAAVSAGYLSDRTQLSIGAVCQAGLELCHKKMVKNQSVRHIERDGHELTLYTYRITGRGRSMCERIRAAAHQGDPLP